MVPSTRLTKVAGPKPSRCSSTRAMASKAGGRQLGQAQLQRGQGALAQRAARLAEDVLGPLEVQVGRPPRQREQAAAGRAHARAQPGPQPFARLGGQRGPHHAPGLAGLAVDQPPPGARVGQLADVHARGRATARAGSRWPHRWAT